MDDEGQLVTREVSNPDYLELQRLLVKARRAAEQAGGVLDRPASLMGTSQVWTGPSVAAGFAAEVAGRGSALRVSFQAFVDEIEHRMSHTPRTITARTRVW